MTPMGPSPFRAMKATLLGASLVLAFVVLAVPPAAAASSCSIGQAGGSCSFSCVAGDRIRVSASAPAGEAVSIQGSCGGASATCSGSTSCSGDSNSPASAPGTGTCTLSAGTSGSCSAAGGGGDASCKVLKVEVPEVLCKVVPLGSVPAFHAV